jgi:hypothetical protein
MIATTMPVAEKLVRWLLALCFVTAAGFGYPTEVSP